MIPIEKYYPEHRLLKHLIKYFWVLDSSRPVLLDHTILPTNNIDILFNFKAPMTFSRQGRMHSTPGNIYFKGVCVDPVTIKQQGPSQTIGVSFFPAGLYPFLNVPISEFKNETIGLDSLLNTIIPDLEEQLCQVETVPGKIRLIESFFIQQLNLQTSLTKETSAVLNHFYRSRLSVREFCRENGVHQKKLERAFNRFVGATPKQFFRLSRFQDIVRTILSSPRSDLTALAHEFEYFDQAHFIKDFKRFSGSSPLTFLKEKRAMKQIIDIKTVLK